MTRIGLFDTGPIGAAMGKRMPDGARALPTAAAPLVSFDAATAAGLGGRDGAELAPWWLRQPGRGRCA